MKEKEDARRKSLAESREELGLSQAFELGKRSTEEYVPLELSYGRVLNIITPQTNEDRSP